MNTYPPGADAPIAGVTLTHVPLLDFVIIMIGPTIVIGLLVFVAVRGFREEQVRKRIKKAAAAAFEVAAQRERDRNHG